MPVEVKHRYTEKVILTLELDSLREADLHGANLRWADLNEADLHGANLHGTDLRWADLCGADLYGADLHGTDLRWADLCGADLYGADLSRANLHEANLRGADLREAKNIPAIVAARLNICPEGELIVWKKLSGGAICKLRIPFEAKRSNATGRKCRAEYAVVIEGEGHSQHDHSFTYAPGKIVRPTQEFDRDRWNECSTGIHFYLTREEAEAH